MSDLQWQYRLPTEQGWYWVHWTGGRIDMWFFDCSDWDIHQLERADRFCGPLQPPELPLDD